METTEAVFSDQEYREMDRGALLMWLDRIEHRRVGGPLPWYASDWIGAGNALHRLGGLMGEW
jgi:hypothetical protein